MRTITIEPSFGAWRASARALLAGKVHPRDVLWVSSIDRAQDFLLFDRPIEPPSHDRQLQVPKEFMRLAKTVCCHRSGKQWAMLYEILWLMTHGEDRNILQNQTHHVVRALEQMRKTVSRDIHKMRAFVRFRKVTDGANDRESYVSWYEPEHLIVRVNMPFFKKRFAAMNWSILTPDACVHWDGEKITYTDGVDKSMAPDGDALEDLWRAYYGSIFNPARLKIKMMQTEMPKKYWKNLPEAEIIKELIQGSADRVQGMLAEEERELKPVPRNDYLEQLKRMNKNP